MASSVDSLAPQSPSKLRRLLPSMCISQLVGFVVKPRIDRLLAVGR